MFNRAARDHPPARPLPPRAGGTRRRARHAGRSAGLAAPPPTRAWCARCARSRRRSGPWSRCCASTPSPAPRVWPDASGRSAAARARRRDRHRADRRPARQGALRRAPGRGPGTACWPACRPAPSSCPSAAARRATSPACSTPRRADGGGGHGARHPAARPAVRAGPAHRRGRWARARDQRAPSRPCASATTCSAKARAARPTRSAITPPMRRRSRHRAGPGGGGPKTRRHSIKLSALFRATRWRRERVFAELLPRVWTLVDAAARADLNLTIDAEESDRLELSLDVFEALARASRKSHPKWRGFGLAIQAYQTRSLAVVEECGAHRAHAGLRFMVRLVKGAYWDGEVKRAQELGPAGYPVFTHKHHTDIAYLACARCSRAAGPDLSAVRHPQRRHHRRHPADGAGRRGGFEMQRLHGMGEGALPRADGSGRRAGAHLRAGGRAPRPARLPGAPAARERRQLPPSCTSSPIRRWTSTLLASPLVPATAPASRCRAISTARGPKTRAAPISPCWRSACRCRPRWRRRASSRCARPRRPTSRPDAAPARRLPALERRASGRTRRHAAPRRRRAGARCPSSAAAAVRRRQDAGRLRGRGARGGRLPALLRRPRPSSVRGTVPAGPTGEHNELRLRPRRLRLHQPVELPLAIFAGQVAAALVAGNTVAAKARRADAGGGAAHGALLHEAGCPTMRCICCTARARPGRRAGGGDPRTAGVSSPARPRWRATSTGRWSPRTAPSCR